MNSVPNNSFSILEYLFQNKNKLYGAYELRTKYSKRMYIAVSATFALSIIVLLIILLPSKATGFVNIDIPDPKIVILPPVVDEPPPLPPPPPPPAAPVEQIRTIQYTDPIITAEVVETDIPPMETIEMSAIATFTQEGSETDIPAFTEAVEQSIVAAPVAPPMDEYIRSVQIESAYPGGVEAWKRFLNRSLIYPSEASDNEIEGFVIVEFKVDEEGNVHSVIAISGPEELKAAAERVIRKSGKWTPAMQNGRKVKSIKKQPIKFVLGR